MELFVAILTAFFFLTFVTKISILYVERSFDPTVITHIFASQSWILISLKAIFPLYRNLLEAVSQRCSVRKGALRNFAKFTGKQLCQSLFFYKVAG